MSLSLRLSVALELERVALAYGKKKVGGLGEVPRSHAGHMRNRHSHMSPLLHAVTCLDVRLMFTYMYMQSNRNRQNFICRGSGRDA